MVNNAAKGIVERALAAGIGLKQIATICNVSHGTVSRWKSSGKANAAVIQKLTDYMQSGGGGVRKYLDEATFEDIIQWGRQRGVRISFTDMWDGTKSVQQQQ